ncbi:flavodoxin family protein [Geodermatophilus aquaeductus]|uniref:Flavodoxin n=1 Tax=Geodermatophilus aquaeductus TaxID=1564161 RepID=A0A521EB05_9ACTN|nr:flavodoxin family protein [Geodermatophilus aquaeductus]SMO81093.1 Flavodoxin [Geodermatophilus aquaeductus]
MIRALVVYESVFGDGRAIAHAIAEGLSSSISADVVAAAEAPSEIGPDVGLLVVGGPNHAFGMPRPSTREGAAKQYGADIPDTGAGLHEWLGTVRMPADGLVAAAFDTRGSGHRMLAKMDHASRTEEKLLTRLGARVVAPAEHFFVVDTKGPLVDGEEDRARAWGRTLAELVASRPLTP